MSSGMWHFVMGWAVSDVLKNRVAFIFRAKHPFFLYFLSLKRHKGRAAWCGITSHRLVFITFILHEPGCVEAINRLLNTALALVEKQNLLQTWHVMFKCGHTRILIFLVELNSRYISIQLSACLWDVGFRYSKMWLYVARLFPGILNRATSCLHVVSKCGWQVLRNLL